MLPDFGRVPARVTLDLLQTNTTTQERITLLAEAPAPKHGVITELP